MHQLTNILFWTKNLGHLPIHLNPAIADKYIMLNGVSGNFCIHFSNHVDNPNEYFSQAWSCNTKNFLVVNDEGVQLFNWHKDLKEEKISITSVKNNLEKFYIYLLAKSHKSERDVVPFVIDIFKQFRSYTIENVNPVEALNLLFVLLASMEDDVATLDRDKWGVSEFELPNGFNASLERFQGGFGDITPDLGLILRHSAGALFQEAQKQVLFFNRQIDLFGTFSSSMITKELLYSSIHYTPSYLARSIVENALKLIDINELNEIKILDPACGSAEFLVEALKQLKERNYQGTVSITGYDSSETAIATSKFLLSYEKRNVWGDNLSFALEKVDDSLTQHWENYNLILMNPPFISWEHLNDKDKKGAVRETLGEHFKGKPNQASAKFYKAILHLLDDGVLGSIIPTSVFTASSYQKLRHEIESLFCFNLVGKLGNFVFEDALTDISIIVGQKNESQNLPRLLWTRNEKGIVHDALRELRKMQYTEEPTKDRVDFSIYTPIQFPVLKDTWKPISLGQHRLLKDIKVYVSTDKLSFVSDIFNVQQGIRTGNNDVFKISDADYSNLSNEEKLLFRPVAENNSVKNGYLLKNKYIWFPYDTTGLIISDEEELTEKADNFYHTYLLPNKEILRARSGINVWWELTRPRNWQFEKSKKLISTEFGNSSSFAIDTSGEFVVERGYAWQPKKKFTQNDYYFYLALFSSPFFDQLLSIYSKELAGGKWYDLGKKSTNFIPIPNVHADDVKKGSYYLKMAELGKKLSEGETYVKAIVNDIVSVFYPLYK